MQTAFLENSHRMMTVANPLLLLYALNYAPDITSH